MLKFVLCVLSIFALATTSFAAEPAKCIIPCKCGCVESGSCMCKNCDTHTADPTSPDFVPPKKESGVAKLPEAYSKAYWKAIADDKPLVVCVGFATECPGAVYVASLEGYKTGDIVVSAPADGQLFHVATYTDPSKVVIPKKVMVGCETGKCTPTYFPPKATSGCAACGTVIYGSCPNCR